MIFSRPINNEQLEAEMEEGLGINLTLTISRTALAHLIMASQMALKQPLSPGSETLFYVFAKVAEDAVSFPPETARLIAQRWQAPERGSPEPQQ